VLSIAACILCLSLVYKVRDSHGYLANSLQVIVARLCFDWSFQWLYFDLLNSAAKCERPQKKMDIDHHIAFNAAHQWRVSCPILCCSHTALIITAQQRRICFHQLSIILWKGTLNTSFEHIFHSHHLLVSTCPWHFFVGTQLLVMMVTTLLALTHTWHASKLSTNRWVLQHNIKQIQRIQK
jgi:hypothetical protein